MAFTASLKDIIANDTSGLLSKHESWERIRLCEVAEILNGAPFDSALFSDTSGIPLVRIRDVVSGSTTTFYVGGYEEQFVVEAGDLLVGMDGDFNSGFWRSQPALLNQRVCRISPDSRWYAKKLLGYVLPGYLAAINANTPSMTVKHLSSKTIGEIALPLPPLPEQVRLAEKLDELFSDLQAATAELKSAQRKLGQYRQSLLKAAVEGALTAEWRAERARRNEVGETGAELLERILRERRARWEAKQIAKFEAQGKTPPNGWRDKYPEPVQPETEGLPALPEGWVWASLSQIGWLDRGRSKHRPRNDPVLYGGPYPFVQTGDVKEADTYLVSSSSSYSEAGRAQSRLWPEQTLCITIAANIGETAILGMQACFPDSVVGFLPVHEDILVRYVEFFLRTARSRIEEKAPATAQKNINLEILEQIYLPLPPAAEQIEIVRVLDETLGEARSRSSDVGQALEYSQALWKGVLKAAFSGQLVRQDPNDEPASVLLERIRAERLARATPAKSSRRKRRSTA